MAEEEDIWAQMDVAADGDRFAQWQIPSNDTVTLESDAADAVCVNIENLLMRYAFDGVIPDTEAAMVVNMLDILKVSIEQMSTPESV